MKNAVFVHFILNNDKISVQKKCQLKKATFPPTITELADFNNVKHEIHKRCVLLPWSGQKNFYVHF
jgi:hypothetical protein